MTRSVHGMGADADIDEALDELRDALDDLKEMEIKEWNVALEDLTKEDDSGLVHALSHAEEPTSRHHHEEDDPEALRVADELAMNPPEEILAAESSEETATVSYVCSVV